MDFLEFVGTPLAKPAPLYIVLAKDAWFHHRTERFLSGELAKAWGAAPELRALDLRELGKGDPRKAAIAEALPALYSSDFFASGTLLVIHAGATLLKEESKLLKALVDHPPERAVAVAFAENCSSPPGVSVDAGTPYETPPFWKEGIPRWENDLAQWVSRLARQDHAKKMVPQSAQELIDLSGSALQTLERDLENLALYVADRPEIRAEDVDALLGERRVPNLFSLEEALLKRDFAGAVEIVKSCFDRGLDLGGKRLETNPSVVSLLIAATVTRTLADLGKAAEAKGEPLAKLFPQKRKAYLYEKALRAGTARSLPAWLSLWTRLDRRLKRGDGPPQIRIETALARMSRS